MAFNVFGKKTEKEKEPAFRRGETLDKVHGDLRKTLWFLDGANKNFDGKEYSDTIQAGEIAFPLTISGERELSAISVQLPVGALPATAREMESHVKPVKGTGYDQMTPQQRGDFWVMLEDPYRLYLPSGYISVLASGLERHMFCGNFEEAFHVLLELRNTQTVSYTHLTLPTKRIV